MKTLQRFQYLKRIAQNEQEIHSAITVLWNKRETQCRNVLLTPKLARKLGVKYSSDIGHLLGLFEEYLQNEYENKVANYPDVENPITIPLEDTDTLKEALGLKEKLK